MTPAELMACTKDVSRVAEGEGRGANRDVSPAPLGATEVREGKAQQFVPKVRCCGNEVLVTGVSSGFGIEGFCGLAARYAGVQAQDGISWQGWDLKAMPQSCSGQG